MAENLDDGEFWLPPQFLTEDYTNSTLHTNRSNGDKCFGRENSVGGFYSPYNEFPYGFGAFGPNSDLSSPVESVVGSTETESDEEDYLAELTRKMAHSTLQDDLWKLDTGLGYENSKPWVMSGSSPQSTLCNVMGGGCGCKQGSSRGSPNCPSPPSVVPMSRSEAAWDLLYAAAGEVARMQMVEEGVAGYYQSRGLLGTPRKPSPVSVPPKNPNPNLGGFHSNHPLSYQQLQANQFQQLKQQQMMKQRQYQPGQSQSQTQQMVQNRARNSGGRPLGLSLSSWPTLQQSQQQQQQPGSGMRAVFLGNTVSKRESTGTGVFLPRRVGTPTETRKKPGCSTVLLPDRVVQALNLNLEAAMDAPPQLQSRCNGTFSADYDAALKYNRNNVLMAQQRRNVRSLPAVMNSEIRLPQEWTY